MSRFFPLGFKWNDEISNISDIDLTSDNDYAFWMYEYIVIQKNVKKILVKYAKL